MDKLLTRAATLFANIDPAQLVEKVVTGKLRYCLAPEREHLRRTGPPVHVLVEAPSSDENSEDDVGFPSIQAVSRFILDSSMLEVGVSSR